MTPAQTRALEAPCFLAGETIHPQYAWREGHVSVVLTVNAGYE